MALRERERERERERATRTCNYLNHPGARREFPWAGHNCRRDFSGSRAPASFFFSSAFFLRNGCIEWPPSSLFG